MIYDGSFVILKLNGVELAFQDSFEKNTSNELVKVASNLKALNSYTSGLQDKTISLSGLLADENRTLLVSAADNANIITIDIVNENISNTLIEQYEAIIENLQEIYRDKNFSTFNAQLQIINQLV